MKKVRSFKLSLTGLLLLGIITTAVAQTTQDTYLGKIEYQDQTITKALNQWLERKHQT